VDDLPVRLADFLESITVRIRSMTTDRIARYVRLGSLGVVVAALGIMALLFLLLAVYGALAIPLGADGAFAALGLITLIAGIIFWTRRSKSA
jgi:hypothetical protein